MRFFPRVRVENRRFSTKIDSPTIVNVRKTVRSSLEKTCDAPIAKCPRKERGVGEGTNRRRRDSFRTRHRVVIRYTTSVFRL